MTFGWVGDCGATLELDGDDGVWMTYGQLAVARDIKRDAARRLAQRHRWRRQTGNDGLSRILVPSEWLATQGEAARIATDVTRDLPVVVVPAASLQIRFQRAAACSRHVSGPALLALLA